MIAFLAQIPTQVATPSSTLDFSVLFIKMLGALAVVVLLAVIILKFIVPKLGFTQRNKFKVIEIRSRFTLEPKKNLYVLRVADRHLVVGTTEQNLQVLTELKPDEVEQYLAEQAGK